MSVYLDYVLRNVLNIGDRRNPPPMIQPFRHEIADAHATRTVVLFRVRTPRHTSMTRGCRRKIDTQVQRELAVATLISLTSLDINNLLSRRIVAHKSPAVLSEPLFLEQRCQP